MSKIRPEGFVIYAQSLRSGLLLPDDSAGRVFKAAASLFLEGQEPDSLELGERIVFSLLRTDIEAAIERHAETCERNRKIANNRTTTRHDSLPTVTSGNDLNGIELNKTELSRIESELNVNKADKPPRAARFTPPTFEEVTAYCRERQNSIDPQRFVDFYASKGWKVGNSAMKDWRAAVRTWEAREDHGTEKQAAALPAKRMSKSEEYAAMGRNHSRTAAEMNKLLADLDKI